MKNSFDKRIQQAEIDKLNLALEKFKETEIDIIKARDEFESYKESLFTTEVRASCDGLVLALNKKEEDDYYYKGEWVAKITPRDEYYICVKEVAEGLSYGEMVSVVVYGENEEDKVTIPGVVISADNILSVENHQSLTYIKLLQDTKDVEWRESIRVYYKSVSLKDVLLLPIRAVQFESLSSGAIAKEIPFVYLYNKDGSVSKRYIEIERDDQANYWVTRGLEIGQQVAVY